ncbi:MAG: cation:proton antiporter [Pyrinomonadaceae bacterium]|nr:cation:proton antiporter [Pyrinomonadaceae bacterium]
MPETSHIPQTVGGVIALLMIAAAVLVLTRRLKFPFTVALVLIGLALSSTATVFPQVLPAMGDLEISPALILYVFLPVLIFESAFNLDPRLLRQNIGTVLTLAVPGLLLSTLLIGVIVTLATPFSLTAALLLGAILSATDPVAVISLFRRLGAPRRLTILVEGESLFNDATSIVLARIMLSVLLVGNVSGAVVARGALDFVIVFVGGLAVGVILGLIAGYLLGAIGSDLYVEITLTTTLAYLSFLLAEEVVHVSGVTATLAAGLTVGSWGRMKISVPIRHHLDQFWAYIAFIANALIFLLVGLRVDLSELWANAGLLTWVVVAMLASRAVVIYGLTPLIGRRPGAEPIDRAYRAVMFWGGLRGAVALAIVLSLPAFPERESFVALVMGAVLFTLLVKGLTIERLVRRLGLDKPPLADRFARLEALFAARRRALSRLPDLLAVNLFNASIADRLHAECERRLQATKAELDELTHRELDHKQQRRIVFLRAFAEEQSAYADLFDKGQLSEPAFRELSLAIGMQQDAMRYRGVHLVAPIRELHRHRIGRFALRRLDRVRFASSLAERLRLRRVALDYDVAWGEYQASSRALDMIENLSRIETIPAGVLKEIVNSYRARINAAQQHLDHTAEQFPEFVHALQEKLGRRLVLLAELAFVERQVRGGTLPPSVADTLTAELEQEMRSLRGHEIAKLKTTPEELLRSVPFLRDLPLEDFSVLAARLHAQTVAARAVIFRQGDPGDALYIIARGVVRISRRDGNDWRHLATLMAGNFFGEAALMERRPRNATVTAMTPCSLYKLRRKDLEVVIEVYPNIRRALEQENQRRKIENADLSALGGVHGRE